MPGFLQVMPWVQFLRSASLLWSLLDLLAHSVSSPWKPARGGISSCTHAHFRLEPEAPCLTAGTSAWGLLGEFQWQARGGCGSGRLGARFRRGDADPGVRSCLGPRLLTVAIRVPYARVSEFDVYFEGVDFKFYAKPYSQASSGCLALRRACFEFI